MTIQPKMIKSQETIKNRLEKLIKQMDVNNTVDLKIQDLEDQMQVMTTVIEKLVQKM